MAQLLAEQLRRALVPMRWGNRTAGCSAENVSSMQLRTPVSLVLARRANAASRPNVADLYASRQGTEQHHSADSPARLQSGANDGPFAAERYWAQMRCKNKLRLLANIAAACACSLPVQAESLTGTVVDPQQRVVVGAKVSLSCGNQTEIRTTDDQGNFSFAHQGSCAKCKIRAEYPGFANLELTVGQERDFILRLRLAEMEQNVVARDDLMSLGSLASVSLSASQLKKISDNSEDLIEYAKRLAGVYSGSDHIYVDGLPADHSPPADRIESITVNADPFSSEYSDGSNTHIEIVTKPGERKFRLSGGGFSLGPGVRDGLNPSLSSSTKTASFGIAGPVPYLPLAFTSDVYFTGRAGQVPIEAVVPDVPTLPATAVGSVVAKDSKILVGFTADYVTNDTLRVNVSLYAAPDKQSNSGVSGVTLPEAGMSRNAAAREVRITFRKEQGRYVYRGGFSADWSDTVLSANSNTLGITVPGAFIAGGAYYNRQGTSRTSWTFKNVLELTRGQRYWSVGATISRALDQEFEIPNPLGHIYFSSLQDYVQSAATGALLGTWFLARGQGQAAYSSVVASPFFEGELVHRSRLSIRGGLRADYQTHGGIVPSPRISTAVNLHGFLLRGGSGIFVQSWSNGFFRRVLEDDGNRLQQFLTTNVSLFGVQNTTPVPEADIVSQVAPRLLPPREWVSKLSLERALGRFLPGIEFTRTEGTHLLGSERLPATNGWIDLLESNRLAAKQQVHFRAQYTIGGQTLTAHYEWTRSFDNTNGPFSFPATESNLAAEWARSAGVSPHNFTLVGNFHMRGGVSLNVVDAWRSSAPYNITTGLDPLHDGVYNDRGGMARNSGNGPSYHSLSLYAYRRTRVPWLRAESKHPFFFNVGIQAENLLGSRNYTSVDAVRSSPIFGQPLTALPGRSLRLRLNFDQ